MNAASPARRNRGGRRDTRTVQAAVQRDLERRRRELVTPEGLALPMIVASRSARAGALILDLVILTGGLVLLLIAAFALGLGLANIGGIDTPPPALEALGAAMLVITFLARYFYFIGFELGPRGATPGKRLAGIRVAARAGEGGHAGRLTIEAIIARNLMRDVEVFLPASFLISQGYADGVAGLAAGIWLAGFALFPLFNRDSLRAGDLVAGTWVVEAERAKLTRALSVDAPPPSEYRFGPAELAVYGEHELTVLEGVLRTDDPQVQREVMEAICRKIGWEPGSTIDGVGDERAFLEAFYAALRAHLERGMRFGRRKKDKFG